MSPRPRNTSLYPVGFRITQLKVRDREQAERQIMGLMGHVLHPEHEGDYTATVRQLAEGALESWFHDNSVLQVGRLVCVAGAVWQFMDRQVANHMATYEELRLLAIAERTLRAGWRTLLLFAEVEAES